MGGSTLALRYPIMGVVQRQRRLTRGGERLERRAAVVAVGLLALLALLVGAPATRAAQAETDGTAWQGLARSWDDGGGAVAFDDGLAVMLDRALLGVDGAVAVAVKDLVSGRGAVLGGDRELPAASLFKLPVMYAVFEAGLPPFEPLVVTDIAARYDLGTLDLPVGSTLTVAEALDRMVTFSDNTSAILLADRVGPWRVNDDLASLGLRNTHYLEERLTTSASDMLTLLELIAREQAVSPESSHAMLDLLLRQRINDRLPRLLPPSTHVAHKTGNLPGIVNDAGVVYGSQSTLVVTVLVSETQDAGRAADAIAQVARVAYDYFEPDSTRGASAAS